MLIAFAVFDSKAAAYGLPIFCESEGLALRGFSDACKNPESPMAKHCADFVLFKIGSYETNSGEFTTISPAVHIANAAAFVGQVPVEPKAEVEKLLKKVPA